MHLTSIRHGNVSHQIDGTSDHLSCILSLEGCRVGGSTYPQAQLTPVSPTRPGGSARPRGENLASNFGDVKADSILTSNVYLELVEIYRV